MLQRKWLLLLFFMMLILGMILGALFFSNGIGKQSAGKSKILYWVAPMDPTYKRDKPGKSPMGMDLVPVYANGTRDSDAVSISPVTSNNLGVKLTTVKRKNLSRTIHTVGYVMADENRIEHIHTFTDGWIKVLNVKAKGDTVRKGELLYKLYSPTLVSAQSEFLLAVKNRNKSLMDAGRKKLLTLGMSKQQIDQLQRTRKVIQNVSVYSPLSGIVAQLKVRTGIYVKPATDTMTIEDLSQIWIIAEVYERQANWVQVGQPAAASFPYFPDKLWQGQVDYVYPQLNPKTHTLPVRLSFPNPDLTLKPNMYANINIYSQQIRDAIAVPRAAVIRTEDGDHVILALGKGKFKPVPVQLGIESGDDYQIISGLEPGMKIVTQAQFLIDSEANVNASLQRMQPKTKAKHQNSLRQYVGFGTIQQIDIAKHQVVLSHQPIAQLKMPQMTMTLLVDKNIDLTTLQPQNKVSFKMIQQADGQYKIVQINKR